MDYDKKYIEEVITTEDYHLIIGLNEGSRLDFNFNRWIKTARFGCLQNKPLFMNVKTDGNKVVWGKGEMELYLDELLDWMRAIAETDDYLKNDSSFKNKEEKSNEV